MFVEGGNEAEIKDACLPRVFILMHLSRRHTALLNHHHLVNITAEQ